jgi:hypothetical protein
MTVPEEGLAKADEELRTLAIARSIDAADMYHDLQAGLCTHGGRSPGR